MELFGKIALGIVSATAAWKIKEIWDKKAKVGDVVKVPIEAVTMNGMSIPTFVGLGPDNRATIVVTASSDMNNMVTGSLQPVNQAVKFREIAIKEINRNGKMVTL